MIRMIRKVGKVGNYLIGIFKTGIWWKNAVSVHDRKSLLNGIV